MKVSIVMCAYNAASFIKEAIDSVQRQTYQDWELVIGDDGSTDDTAAIISGYLADRRIRLISREKNIGYVANKNALLREATGELLTQLDADDLSAPDRIQKQVEVLRYNPEYMVCGTNYYRADVQGNRLSASQYPKDLIIDKPQRSFPFWFPSLLFRRSLLEEIGLFSEYFSGIYGDDAHWTFRVLQRYPIYFLSEPLYGYRVNPASISSVLDNPRKLMVDDILDELFRQRQKTGTDYLDAGNWTKMEAFEQSLFRNRHLMARRYTQWAVRAIDNYDLTKAKSLLKKALPNGLYSVAWYRALAYLVKRQVSEL